MDEILNYLSVNVETGVITWIVKPNDCTNLGVAGSTRTRYLEVRFKGKRYYGHNIVWRIAHGYWPTMLDHKNRNKRDNRLENLREVTRSQNQHNKDVSKNNRSGYKGVSWKTRAKLWRVSIWVDSECIHVGYFKLLSDAVKARDVAYRHYHKDCVCI